MINTLTYIKNFLKIRTKDGQLIPFNPNKPQMKLYNEIKRQASLGKPIRIIILKARQMGFTTMAGAVNMKLTATEKYVHTGIITHLEKTTNEIFDMYKRYYYNLPNELKPDIKASNSKELVFNTKDGMGGLDSKIKCMTATDDGVGRGETYNYLHMSEYGYWNNADDVYVSLMQSVPDTANSMVIIESTANGYNSFKELWDMAVAGNSSFTPLFFAWYEMDTYRSVYNGFELTAEEEELKERFNLDNEQIAWRRNAIADKCKGDVDKFHQEYPSTPEEAFLYSGNSYFSMENIKNQKESLKPALKVGRFSFKYENNKISEIKWVDDPTGEIKIYEDVKYREPYVIGGDTSGEGSDYFIGQVLDNITGKQVAILRHEYDELSYSQQMYCLGMYYNTALLGIEMNFSTYPNSKLEEWGYTKIYQREATDTFTHKTMLKYGFRTDTITRPLILASLQAIVKDNVYLINDYETLCELESFVKNEKGRAEAMEGKHDDCVMGLAIAYYCRCQQTFDLLEENKVEEKEYKVPFALQDSKEKTGGDEFVEW